MKSRVEAGAGEVSCSGDSLVMGRVALVLKWRCRRRDGPALNAEVRRRERSNDVTGRGVVSCSVELPVKGCLR